MSNILESNAFAIAELFKGNDLVAQNAFRENVLTLPSCMSLNNLGVYYSQYGMILKNGKRQSAKKLGLRLLLRASAHAEDWRNCASVATALLEVGDIPQAYRFILRAHTLMPDPLLLYNHGVSLTRLGKYNEAILVFKKLCKSNDCIVKNCGTHPFIVLAFCYYKMQDTQACLKYIQSFRRIMPTAEYLDIFQLRFLCGEYKDALSESEALLNEWYPTDSILAMLAECVAHFPAYDSIITAALIPTHQKQWKRMKENSIMRSQTLQALSYAPPFIDTYFFIE